MPNFPRTDNFIKIAVNRSFFGGKSIIDAFDDNLKAGNADTEIMDLYTSFHPFRTANDSAYSSWSALRSSSTSKTLGVVQLIDQLTSNKIRTWDIAIQAVYDNKTTQYNNLLPHHRIPFQSGTVASRTIAINNLLTAMGTDASLAATKTIVADFALLLKNATELQTSQIKGIDAAILVMETASNNASDEAFRVYGSLMVKFYKTPKSADIFFPIALLQSVSQSSFTATLASNKIKKIFKRKLDVITQTLRCMNWGTEILKGYFTNGFSDEHTPGTPIFDILPNAISVCNPAAMGYTDEKRHLHIVNTGLTPAIIEIDIMVAS